MVRSAGNCVFDEVRIHVAEEGGHSEAAFKEARFSAILELPDLERFVYVLSVIEGCTDQQCADLLGVSARQIEQARLRALQHFWKRN